MSEGGHPIDVTHTSYSMGASASWEIDVFGGVRRGIEASAAEYKAALANKAAARISVAAEVARNYFTYRCVQQEILITKNNLETQRGRTGQLSRARNRDLSQSSTPCARRRRWRAPPRSSPRSKASWNSRGTR